MFSVFYGLREWQVKFFGCDAMRFHDLRRARVSLQRVSQVNGAFTAPEFLPTPSWTNKFSQVFTPCTLFLVCRLAPCLARGLRHGSYVRATAEQIVQDGAPGMVAHSFLDIAAGAMNLMSRTRHFSGARWVPVTQSGVQEFVMIDDEDAFPADQDDELARSLRCRDAAKRAFTHVDTDQRLRKAAASASRPTHLTVELW